MSKIFEGIKGILSDIDGTLYNKGEPVSGAIEAVNRIKKKGIKFLFFTNTDSKTPKTIHNMLIEYGFQIDIEEIYTPIIAVKKFLEENKVASIAGRR